MPVAKKILLLGTILAAGTLVLTSAANPAWAEETGTAPAPPTPVTAAPSASGGSATSQSTGQNTQSSTTAAPAATPSPLSRPDQDMIAPSSPYPFDTTGGTIGSGPTGPTRPPRPNEDGTMPYLPDSIPMYQYTKDQNGDWLETPLQINQAEQYFAAIYSGSTLGTYYYVAGAICNTLRDRMEVPNTQVFCSPLRSGGVGANVNLLKEGRAQFGIVQSDTNYYAAQGLAPIPRARSVMSLHDEMGVFIARPEVTITQASDLSRLRVNIAKPGTASRQLWEDLLGAYGMTVDDIGTVTEVAQEFNVQGLCGNDIDAFALWIGHPNRIIQEAITDCNAQIMGLWGPPVSQLIESNPFLFKMELPLSVYQKFDAANDPCATDHGAGYLAAAATQDSACVEQAPPIETYGFKASLIAREEARPEVVYLLVKTLIEQVEYFKTQHPTLVTIDAWDMFDKGNYLPFHEGAARYYKERGWLTEDGKKVPRTPRTGTTSGTNSGTASGSPNNQS